MLLQGGEVENEEEDILEDNQGVKTNGVPVIYPVNGHSQNGHWITSDGRDGKPGFVSKSLEGRAVAALNRFGQNAKMLSDPTWMSRLQPSPVPPVMEIEKPTFTTIWSSKGVSGRLFMLGEAVHIFRPLIYVLLIRKFGIKSWTPWLVSLAVELTSLGIHSHARDLNHRAGKVHQLSSAERDEVRRFQFFYRVKLCWLCSLGCCKFGFWSSVLKITPKVS
ncbi:peroxisome biogenesis protein 16-like [Hordeum vulgare subsp. vulgare]|uniref:peroxisome biogenesis protein 16-like n=1 Tax=Hordeum vulgare subsp. vulgare TaxID=112509 RepID=UPI000B46C918|nr:peroxisome biogenesis protein 16-like [Hordeum vulgare subsp. vulgare]